MSPLITSDAAETPAIDASFFLATFSLYFSNNLAVFQRESIVQRARNPGYAATMDAQPKPKD